VRNISFALTTQQVRDRQKTVTRRLGWRRLQVGTQLRGVVKSQGLKKGQTVETLARVRVVGVSFEPLRRMVDEPVYGSRELSLEGFAQHQVITSPEKFVAFFMASHDCGIDTEITRIEFVYEQEGADAKG
jgi:hypothetical protein